MQQWDEAEEFLLAEACADLEAGATVRPCVVAYQGDRPLFLAFLRPSRGHCADALIELLALAGALGADRIAVSVSGRAWSLDDPLPPVVAGVGDLRQRVVCIITADGCDGPARVSHTVRPFTVAGDVVHWEPRLEPGAGEGWLQDAVRVTVDGREVLRSDVGEARQQARRCVTRGHLLALHSDVEQRLKIAGR